MRHVKLVSFLQECSFVIKNFSRVENKVVDALSHKRSLVVIKGVISHKKCLASILEVEGMNLVSMKDLYKGDANSKSYTGSS